MPQYTALLSYVYDRHVVARETGQAHPAIFDTDWQELLCFFAVVSAN